jgi:hypothetical protein
MASLGQAKPLPRWNIFYFPIRHIHGVSGVPHFGAIHSRRQNEIRATVPTPPSQSAANHNRRCGSGRGFGSVGVNDSRFPV